MKDKSGAIGLSVNILVVIIISLVIFSSGIILLNKFIEGAEDIKAELDLQTDQELDRLLLSQGKIVALPRHVAYVYAGDSHIFGIGILNINEDDQFLLEISVSSVITEDSTSELEAEALEWLFYNGELIEIKENEHRKEAILVTIPKDAPKGQYIYNVQVRKGGGSPYGKIQKFTVNVK